MTGLEQTAYIDFHVHAYAAKVAQKAVKTLSSCPEVDHVYTDGTVASTRKALENCGAQYGVILPIATKPAQTGVINDWAIKHNHGNFICFGTVHPDNGDAERELERIAAAGLRGIKLHPDYQGCFMFEPRMQKIYRKCEELGLIISLHMGYDPISVRTRHAMPCDLAEVSEKYPDLKLIGAHLGGMSNWERAAHYLKGAGNVWLDTAFCAEFITDEMFIRLLECFGEDRILLGSDLPWSLLSTQAEMIRRLNIEDRAKRKIFRGNAASLLGIKE